MANHDSGLEDDIGFQIAPMIDLILVLMVFFMSTVALKQVENELGITLPGKAPLKQTDASRVGITVGIEVDGSVTLNSDLVGEPRDQKLSLLRTRLVEQVQLFDDKTPVIIAPQPSVPHGRVIDVLNACSAAKVKNIAFRES